MPTVIRPQDTPLCSAFYPSLTEYDVLYAVYSTLAREWSPFRTRKNKFFTGGETIKDLLLTNQLYPNVRRYWILSKREKAATIFVDAVNFFECDLVPTDKLPVIWNSAAAKNQILY